MVNKLYLWIIGLIAIGASVLLPQLKPSKLEFANIYFLDKKYEKSAVLYNELWHEGHHGVNVLVPLIQLSLQEGNIDRAVELMERYVKVNPNSVQARNKMTNIYKQAYLPEKYQHSLEASYQLKPSPNKARELSQIYNYNSQYRKQKSILQNIISNQSPIEKDYYDLAYLYARDGDYDQAITVMYELMHKTKQPSITSIQLTMTLLFDAHKGKEAMQLAQNFAQENIKLNVALAGYLQSIGAADLAYQLLAPLEKKHINNSIYLEGWMEVNYSLGKSQYVYNHLRKLYAENKLPRNVQYLLFQLAPDYAQPDFISKLISQTNLEDVPHERLVMAIEGLLSKNYIQLLEQLKNKLPPYIIQSSPLINFLLSIPSFDQNNNSKITNTIYNKILSPEQKMLVISIFIKRKQNAYALSILQSLTPSQINEIDKIEYATDLISLNRPDIGVKQFSNSTDIKDKMALTMLYAMKSSTETSKSIINFITKNKTKIKPLSPYIKTLYYIANDHQQNSLALLLAQELYNIDPNMQNTEILANAYINDHNIAASIPHFKKLANQGNLAHQEMYLYALSELNHSTEIITDQQKLDLKNIAENMLGNPDLDDKKRSEVTSTLLENGYKDIAETQYKLLALGKSPTSKEIQQLLYVWGPSLSDNQVEWIKQRALADKKDPTEWLLLLNNIGLSFVSIDLVNNHPNHFNTQKSKNIYLQALVQEEQKDEIIKAINKIDLNSLSIEELEKLATTLFRSKQNSIKDKIYKIILTKQPQNYTALVFLAKSYFEAGLFYDSAELYAKLDEMHKIQPQDLFRYAGSLRNTYRIKDSRLIYHRFLFLSDKNQKYSKLNNQEKAQLAIAYSITNQFEAANKIYLLILASEPNSKSVKTNYVNFLIDNGRFDKAEKILNGINAGNKNQN